MIYIHVGLIHDNPYQTRSNYDAIDELAADIRLHQPARPQTLGLQQVPAARVVFRTSAETRILGESDIAKFVNSNGRFIPHDTMTVELEFGHRRLRAFRHLVESGHSEYTYMPLHIIVLTDEQMLDGVWSENQARRDISDVERAELIRKKLDAGHTQQEIADAWGLSRSQVSWLLGLLSLPEEIKQANKNGSLPARTAYALRDVIKLAEITDKWQRPSDLPYMAEPPKPAKMLEEIMSNPAAFTSDAVRAYTSAAVQYASYPLPEIVAKFNTDAENVRQPTCSGCTKRINNNCFDGKCLRAKKLAWQAHALAVASNETGIQISDDAAHFPGDYESIHAIKTAYLAGNYDGLVIGWLGIGTGGYRPYHEQSGTGYLWNDEQSYENNGRNGIVIGSTNIQQVIQKITPQLPSILNEWKTLARTYAEECRQSAIQQLVDHIYMPMTDEVMEVICALIGKPGREWSDEYDERITQLVWWLCANGRGIPAIGSNPYDNMRVIKKMDDVLNQLGIRPAHHVEQDIILAVVAWYHMRDMYYSVESREVIYNELKRLAAAYTKNNEYADELHRALRDAEDVIADDARKLAAWKQEEQEEA